MDSAYTKSSFTQNQAHYLNGSNDSRVLNTVAGSHEISESFIELITFRRKKKKKIRGAVGQECFFKVSKEGV